MGSGAYLQASDLRPGLGYGLRFEGERNAAFYVVAGVTGSEVIAHRIIVSKKSFTGLGPALVGRLQPGRSAWRPDPEAQHGWEGAAILAGETAFALAPASAPPVSKVSPPAVVPYLKKDHGEPAPQVPADEDAKARAQRVHRELEVLLARELRSRGVDPLGTGSTYGLEFDIGWRNKGRFYVVEIKSITYLNEKDQIRHAIGQVFDYRYLLARHSEHDVVPLIFVEYEPDDVRFVDLCSELDIRLFWPDEMERVLDDLCQ